MSRDPLGSDTVRDALEPLLAGRIGEPRDLAELAKEGAKRYGRKVPPGWADEKKPDPERYGDLAIWLDVIERAKADDKPVILVTEDRKEDWWWIRSGKTIGPQPQLVEEMQKKARQKFWMYTLGPFMEEAAKYLNIELKDAERDDVERAESAAQRKHVFLSDYVSRRDGHCPKAGWRESTSARRALFWLLSGSRRFWPLDNIRWPTACYVESSDPTACPIQPIAAGRTSAPHFATQTTSRAPRWPSQVLTPTPGTSERPPKTDLATRFLLESSRSHRQCTKHSPTIRPFCAKQPRGPARDRQRSP